MNNQTRDFLKWIVDDCDRTADVRKETKFWIDKLEKEPDDAYEKIAVLIDDYFMGYLEDLKMVVNTHLVADKFFNEQAYGDKI